jgi:hypothetical protein
VRTITPQELWRYKTCRFLKELPNLFYSHLRVRLARGAI